MLCGLHIFDMLQRLTTTPAVDTTGFNPPRSARFALVTPLLPALRAGVPIETLPGCVTPDNPDRYPEPINSHEFLQQRLREIKLV